MVNHNSLVSHQSSATLSNVNFLVLLSIVSKLCVCVQRMCTSLAVPLIFKVCLAVGEDSWYQSEELCK